MSTYDFEMKSSHHGAVAAADAKAHIIFTLCAHEMTKNNKKKQSST
jgi:hypothetical protein